VKYTIESDEFIAIVESKGAELISLTSRSSFREYIWEGNPEIWEGQSPVLFPIVGILKNGKYLLNGKEYSIPKHGFIRRTTKLTLKNQTTDRLVFELLPDDEIKQMFPFDFLFQISFHIMGNKLIVTYKVENRGDSEMFFSIGAHPAFNCPIREGDSYDDCYIEFEEDEVEYAMLLNRDGLIGRDVKEVFEGDKIRLSHELFANDVLMFKSLKSREVSLRSVKTGTTVIVKFGDFEYLGIWSKPNGDFVSIEPWNGINDFEYTNSDIKTKEGIITLGAWSTFQASYSIEVEE